MVRAEYAAGQDYPTYPDVFHNATLRHQMYEMWRFVSNYYKDTDYVMGYSKLSLHEKIVIRNDINILKRRLHL